MKKILLLIMVCFTAISANSQNSDRGYKVKVGDSAPDFTIELLSGEKISTKDLRGKIVMLQFTASWCGVCRKEMPFIESEIWQKHKDNPQFALIGIDRDEPREKMEMLVSKTGISYPLGFDPKGIIFELYAEKDAGITRNVIIDTNGKIIMQTRLYDEDEFNEMCSLIEKELSNIKK
ncbi:MAG: TlpA family protein disulfide reductase [Bacteroidales bacterium]